MRLHVTLERAADLLEVIDRLGVGRGRGDRIGRLRIVRRWVHRGNSGDVGEATLSLRQSDHDFIQFGLGDRDIGLDGGANSTRPS